MKTRNFINIQQNINYRNIYLKVYQQFIDKLIDLFLKIGLNIFFIMRLLSKQNRDYKAGFCKKTKSVLHIIGA